MQSDELDLATYIGNSFNFVKLIHHALEKHKGESYEHEGANLEEIVNKWDFKNFKPSKNLQTICANSFLKKMVSTYSKEENVDSFT